jgi:hypothetical protein
LALLQKKEVQDEISRLEVELKDRHDAELRDFKDAAPVEEAEDSVKEISETLEQSHLDSGATPESKVNRQKKRKVCRALSN